MSALEVRQVGKTYRARQGGREVEALRAIDLTVPAGEFVALVGASGSGKSTFARLIGGLDAPTRGEISVGGRPVSGPGRDRGFVFQADRLFPWRTVLDNVAFGLQAQGTPRRAARAAAAVVVERVGLSGFEGAYPHELSGGMRQRVNLARALATDPALLLMDEPFAALDAQTREVMQAELLRVWARHQKTVVFITHQIDEAVYLADRVVVFSARPGTVRADIRIDLPRPRPLALKRQPAFAAYADRIWRLIQHDVLQGLRLPLDADEPSAPPAPPQITPPATPQEGLRDVYPALAA
jgi:NitT/TauT family transport system ATP-binding protein